MRATIEVSTFAKLVEDEALQCLTRAGLAPIAKPPLAHHARAAEHLKQDFPGDARAQYEQNADERRAMYTFPATANTRLPPSSTKTAPPEEQNRREWLLRRKCYRLLMQRIGTGKAMPTSEAARALRDIESSFEPAAFARLAAQAGVVGAKSNGSTYLWSEFDILSAREILLKKNGRHVEADELKARLRAAAGATAHPSATSAQQSPMPKKPTGTRGSTEKKRTQLFDAVLAALKSEGLPCEPLPAYEADNRTISLTGPGTWLRYFISAELTNKRLAAGLFVPKNQYGETVHKILLDEGKRLEQALGGPIKQHKEVAKAFRHYVVLDHKFDAKSITDATRWYVAKIRSAKQFVDDLSGSLSIDNIKHIQAALDEANVAPSKLKNGDAPSGKSEEVPPVPAWFFEPTEDPDALDNAARMIGFGRRVDKPVGNLRPVRVPSPSGDRFKRCPHVVAYVRQHANGRCQSCGKVAPFKKDDGNPYLEVHHLQRLAENGSDTPDNTIAVCPNCHRQLHYGCDRAELAAAIKTRLADEFSS